MVNFVIEMILVALGVASITFTICVTSVFKWLRELVSPIHTKVEELIHCPWCLSFWVLMIFYFIIPNNLHTPAFTQYAIINSMFTIFAIYSVIGLIHYVLLRAYEPIHKFLIQREINKLKEK